MTATTSQFGTTSAQDLWHSTSRLSPPPHRAAARPPRPAARPPRASRTAAAVAARLAAGPRHLARHYRHRCAATDVAVAIGCSARHDSRVLGDAPPSSSRGCATEGGLSDNPFTDVPERAQRSA